MKRLYLESQPRRCHSLACLSGLAVLSVLLTTNTAAAQQISLQVTNWTTNKVDAYRVDANGREELQEKLLPTRLHSLAGEKTQSWVFKVRGRRVGGFRPGNRAVHKYEIVNDGSQDVKKSPSGTGSTNLTIRNSSVHPQDVYWTDFEGNRIWITELPPGGVLQRQAGTGHLWVARNKRTRELSQPILVQANQPNEHQITPSPALKPQELMLVNHSQTVKKCVVLLPGRTWVRVPMYVNTKESKTFSVPMGTPSAPGVILVIDGKNRQFYVAKPEHTGLINGKQTWALSIYK